ncbi:MAG: hypothetical protein KAH56_07370 [Candidatus Krumholzibacteria bacterium]|nr:hypothetical protein [Candidatus Krumholzibacteria bacterium]
MINQKYIELMNQEFDGANSPEQSRDLEDYLRGHEEARTYYRELALALNVFEKVAMLNPPPELGDEILARLKNRAGAHSATDGGGLLAACRNLFRLRLRPAYAYTFIGGLALGLVLFAGSARLTSNELSGQVRGTATHQRWAPEEGAETTLTYPGISGRYHILREGPDLRFHLELSSDLPTVIRFHTEGNTSSSVVEMTHEGEESYDITFTQDVDIPSQITFMIFSEGRLIHTEILNEQGK